MSTHTLKDARFLAQHQVTVLNVAGKRESSAPGISGLVRQVLAQALRVQREGAGHSQATL